MTLDDVHNIEPVVKKQLSFFVHCQLGKLPLASEIFDQFRKYFEEVVPDMPGTFDELLAVARMYFGDQTDKLSMHEAANGLAGSVDLLKKMRRERSLQKSLERRRQKQEAHAQSEYLKQINKRGHIAGDDHEDIDAMHAECNADAASVAPCSEGHYKAVHFKIGTGSKLRKKFKFGGTLGIYNWDSGSRHAALSCTAVPHTTLPQYRVPCSVSCYCVPCCVSHYRLPYCVLRYRHLPHYRAPMYP